MKKEENDIPSCDLSGFVRPNPIIVSSPLSTFFRSSPEDSPIIPETQVGMLAGLLSKPLQVIIPNRAALFQCCPSSFYRENYKMWGGGGTESGNARTKQVLLLQDLCYFLKVYSKDFSFRLHLYKCISCSQMEKQPQCNSNDVLAREFIHSLGKGFSAYRYLTSWLPCPRSFLSNSPFVNQCK